MTPSPAAASRLSLLGCGLLAALALAVSGCGEEGSAARESATAPESRSEQRRAGADQGEATMPASASPAASAGCPRQLDAFVSKLRTLRRQLAVGLSYDQYMTAVKDLRASYDAIPIERLTLDCLAAGGTPAEHALNEHIDAANAWGECLADATCTTVAIEPVLQRKWRVASRHLSEAR